LKGEGKMSYKVVYFTRTGNSKRVADKIAEKLSCSSIEVTDNMNWNGVIGYLKGGFYAARNKEVEIKVNSDINKEDKIILVTPLWAGGPTPAIRTFLKKVPFEEFHLVITSESSDPKKSSTKYERKYTNFKSLYGVIKKRNNEELVIEELTSNIK